jgi:hypothetical protein
MKSVLDGVSSVVTLFGIFHWVHALNAFAIFAALYCIEVMWGMTWYPSPVVSRSVNAGIWWWLWFMHPNENVSTDSAWYVMFPTLSLEGQATLCTYGPPNIWCNPAFCFHFFSHYMTFRNHNATRGQLLFGIEAIYLYDNVRLSFTASTYTCSICRSLRFLDYSLLVTFKFCVPCYKWLNLLEALLILWMACVIMMCDGSHRGRYR